MSWASSLCALYDANAWRAGEVEMWNGKPLTLMPIGFDTMEAQSEITIDINGNFITARSLDKSEAETLVPYPEGRTSGEKALPLFDKLIYIAGDYPQFVIAEQEKGSRCHKLYIDGLSAWCNSQFSHSKVRAIHQYVSQNCMLADLIRSHAFVADDAGQLDRKVKIQNISQSDAFVRFRVYTGDPAASVGSDDSINASDSAVWLDKTMHEQFLLYYMASTDEKELCYISGIHMRSAKMSPIKIRNKGDQTRLISSNDSANYTYRGRFNTKDKETGYNEALSTGYESSQKAINALKWIIRRQGYQRDGVCIVTWENSLKVLPNFHDSAVGVPGVTSADESALETEVFFEDEIETIVETNYLSAQDFNAALNGYSASIDNLSNMVVLAVDSATKKGRLALTYYKELTTSRYLDSIRKWHDSCCWQHEYFKDKRFCRYEGMASISETAKVVYGTERNKRLTLRSNSDGKTPLLIAMFDRLCPSIIDGAAIPRDIVYSAVQKASNPLAYESEFNYSRTLHIACSLVKRFYWEKGVIFDMKLDEQCTDRSYLYGRLLAVAEKVERNTYEKGETRTTNAERYMQQFSRAPMRTWEIIRRNTQIYLKQLKPGSREYYKNLYGEITELFEEGAFESKGALDGRFLLGYDCQRTALRYKKDESTLSQDKDGSEISETEGN